MLEFYKDRIKKQSVKNFMLHNSRGQFIMQFGRSKEDNVFALDFTGPFSPLAAFGVALVSANRAYANPSNFCFVPKAVYTGSWLGGSSCLVHRRPPDNRLKANMTPGSSTNPKQPDRATQDDENLHVRNM